MPDKISHPCVRCGACCATFRVSFYWSESDPTLTPNAVPIELTEKLTAHRAHMKHADSIDKHRCVALKGEIGTSVGCSIYENRSTPCRDFEASYESGEPHLRCDKARANHGLAPLTPNDWQN